MSCGGLRLYSGLSIFSGWPLIEDNGHLELEHPVTLRENARQSTVEQDYDQPRRRRLA
jgi:hypothetical protein